MFVRTLQRMAVPQLTVSEYWVFRQELQPAVCSHMSVALLSQPPQLTGGQVILLYGAGFQEDRLPQLTVHNM